MQLQISAPFNDAYQNNKYPMEKVYVILFVFTFVDTVIKTC